MGQDGGVAGRPALAPCGADQCAARQVKAPRPHRHGVGVPLGQGLLTARDGRKDGLCRDSPVGRGSCGT